MRTFAGVNRIGSDRGVGGRYFQGRMANVAVFYYALTPTQIAQLFAVAAPPATVTLHSTQPDASGNFTIGGVTGTGQSVRLWKSTDLSVGAAGWTQVQTTTANGAGASASMSPRVPALGAARALCPSHPSSRLMADRGRSRKMRVRRPRALTRRSPAGTGNCLRTAALAGDP